MRNYKWKVLGVVIFGIFMVVLDTTVVNVALPTIRDQFHATLPSAQWIVSLYVLTLGIMTPVAGFLADRFGIKRVYLLALALFAAGSLGSGLAPSLASLIATRAVQGAGGGLALPLGTAMLFEAFPPKEQGFALGLYGIGILMAPALGPVLGGYLVDRDLWRWAFFINVPIGISGIALGRWLLKEQRAEGEVKPDPLGLVASIVGFGALLYGASIAAQAGWSSPIVLVAFALGVGGLIAFAAVEMKVADDPLLDLDLFGNWTFLNASLVGWVTVMALFGAEFLMPIYLQTLRGQPAFSTGLILLPLAITAGIVTPIAGRIYDRIGPRAIVVFGFIVLSVNTWQLSKLTGTTSVRWVVFLMAMRGLAFGSTVQSTYATALGTVEPRRVSRGSALVNSMRFVMQSVAVAVFATIVASAVSPPAKEVQSALQRRTAAQQRGFGFCESTRPNAVEAAHTPAPALRRVCDENMRGFGHAYRVTFWFSLLALVLSLHLPGWPGKWRGREQLRGT